MKVNVLKKTDNELKIEVEGAGHSLLNVLQKTLLEDDTNRGCWISCTPSAH